MASFLLSVDAAYGSNVVVVVLEEVVVDEVVLDVVVLDVVVLPPPQPVPTRSLLTRKSAMPLQLARFPAAMRSATLAIGEELRTRNPYLAFSSSELLAMVRPSLRSTRIPVLALFEAELPPSVLSPTIAPDDLFTRIPDLPELLITLLVTDIPLALTARTPSRAALVITLLSTCTPIALSTRTPRPLVVLLMVLLTMM